MTYATNAAGENLLFQFGNGATPEVFTSSCSINTDRKFEIKSKQWTGEVPDCDNPSAPNKTVRRTQSIDYSFTGAGVADQASFQTLIQLQLTGQPFDGIVKQNLAGVLGWTFSGLWLIETLSLTGKQHEDQTFDITIMPADFQTFTPG